MCQKDFQDHLMYTLRRVLLCINTVDHEVRKFDNYASISLDSNRKSNS